jgi:hypothetical protein
VTQAWPLIRSLLGCWWIAPSKQNESTTIAESLTAYSGGLIAIMSSQLATMASQISESEKRKASRDVISAPSALDCHRKGACHLRQAEVEEELTHRCSLHDSHPCCVSHWPHGDSLVLEGLCPTHGRSLVRFVPGRCKKSSAQDSKRIQGLL